MKNVQLSHRMYSISDIKRLLENKDLIIQPKYQRRRTKWPQTAKTSLIDTVLNNYPIQPIYLREYVTSNKERKKEIIDGGFLTDDCGFYRTISYLRIFSTSVVRRICNRLAARATTLLVSFNACSMSEISIFIRCCFMSMPSCGSWARSTE